MGRVRGNSARRWAGYLHGNLEHHLDHLGPLCSLLGYPLIVTEEDIYQLAIAYYPNLMVHHCSPVEAPFFVTDHFETVITTLPRIAFEEIFCIAEMSRRKRVKSVWLPHGNSDKGHLTRFMEILAHEETILVYGPKMIDFLDQAHVVGPCKIPIGNFRYLYFERHRQFYEELLSKRGLSEPFLLYAPTWNDAENSSSFEKVIDELIRYLSDHRLVVKPHPNQSSQGYLIQKQLQAPVTWLDHFPPIYPLLDKTSHLLGDFSSIGYDFLQFNRPMFFF